MKDDQVIISAERYQYLLSLDAERQKYGSHDAIIAKLQKQDELLDAVCRAACTGFNDGKDELLVTIFRLNGEALKWQRYQGNHPNEAKVAEDGHKYAEFLDSIRWMCESYSIPNTPTALKSKLRELHTQYYEQKRDAELGRAFRENRDLEESFDVPPPTTQRPSGPMKT